MNKSVEVCQDVIDYLNKAEHLPKLQRIALRQYIHSLKLELELCDLEQEVDEE